MSDEKVLTKEIAEEWIADNKFLEFREFTAIEDAAAESLSKHCGELTLGGLTSLSNAAAESLSKCEGDLWLDLDELPESAAGILRNHPSFAEEDDWDDDDD